MGEAFLVRRGGGKKNVMDVGVALIGVKFPAGSTCTCEKDNKRYTSDSASGVAAFSVPEAGTWTLTITDGTSVKSNTVTVASGDVETLTLAYSPDELVILSPNDGLASGYSGHAYGEGSSAVVQNNVLIFDNQGYLTPDIDLTEYSTLTVTGVTVSSYALARFFVDGSGDNACQTYAQNSAYKHSFSLFEETIVVDVSELSGSYYIGNAAGGAGLHLKSIVLA